MTRRRPQRDPQSKPVPSDANLPTPVGFMGLWLLSLLWMLGNSPLWFSRSQPLVSWPLRSPLAPEWVWNVPLGSLAADGLPIELPQFLWAVVAAACIAALCHCLQKNRGLLPALGGLIVWSLTFPEDQLGTAALMLVPVALGKSKWMSPSGKVVALSLWAAVCPLVTIDFGWLWLCAGLLFLPKWLLSGQSPRSSVAAMAMLIAGTVLVASLHSGFLMALLRPANWMWWRPPADMLEATQFALLNSQRWFAHLLLSLLLVGCWWDELRRPATSRWSLIPLAILSGIGWACGYFLWLATWGLASRSASGAPLPAESTSPRPRYVFAGLILLACARLVPLSPQLGQELASGGAATGRLDPEAWSLSGPVLLRDLNQCRDWETSPLAQRYPLIVTDRWDVFGPVYPRLDRLYRDTIEARSEAYLLSDGSWGGYYAWTAAHQPTLLVVDSRALHDLRQLSLSPHWNLLGCDAQRTILARADDPQAQPWLQKAAATFARLEWPGLSGTPLDPNVVVVETPDDYRRVACVLVAWRLPYAALRVLRAEPNVSQPELEGLCYLELIHRSQRYAGTASLIDHVRAIDRIAQARKRGWKSPAVREITIRSLNATGLSKLMLESPVEANGTAEPDANAEARFRELLNRGDITGCRVQLARIEPASRSFYQFLLDAGAKSPSTLADELGRLLETSAVPEHLRGEAEFTRGCLAIEAGDPPTAVEAFNRSAAVDPHSPFAPLRSLYLRQIVSQ